MKLVGGNVSAVSSYAFPKQVGLGVFLFTTTSGTALRSTQLPIQWVSGAPFWGGGKEASA